MHQHWKNIAGNQIPQQQTRRRQQNLGAVYMADAVVKLNDQQQQCNCQQMLLNLAPGCLCCKKTDNPVGPKGLLRPS
jgi:G3E family GTPase